MMTMLNVNEPLLTFSRIWDKIPSWSFALVYIFFDIVKRKFRLVS